MILDRYPHTGVIKIVTETESKTGIPSLSTKEIKVKGRYEQTAVGKNIDYSSVFYTTVQKEVNTFEADGQTFVYENRSFKITHLKNKQTHCEIWLD